MIKIIRWAVSLAGAAALLILVVPLPAAAGGGSTLQSDGQPQPGRGYSGWVDIDVQRSWSAPNTAARLVQNDFHFFIRRFRADLRLTWGSGSNPPGSVTITPKTFQFYAMFTQRVEPPEDMPDMCRGYAVTVIGEGTFAGYSGSPSDSSTAWQIPGLRFTPGEMTPDITFLGGNCEPGRSPLQESTQSGLRAEMGIPGGVQWTFTEGIRTPRSSATPTSIEGSCDAPVYSQSGGRIQCHWQVNAGAPPLVPGGQAPGVVPPRRR
jgi:hypothetical protein